MPSLALLSTVPALVGVPVVDIDGTFFIQGGIYVALLLVLRPLLFGPWLATRQRRIDAIDGALANAKTLRVEADALSSDYDAQLAQARDTALSDRSHARRDVEAAQAKELGLARDAAAKQLLEQRGRLGKQAEVARVALQSKVEDLAAQISEKILGTAP